MLIFARCTPSYFKFQRSNLQLFMLRAMRYMHWKEKWIYFDLKSWVTGGTKVRPGIPSQLFNIESQFKNWTSISNQFDSNILQLLGIPGRTLVPPVTQLFRSKWLHFFFQWTCYAFSKRQTMCSVRRGAMGSLIINLGKLDYCIMMYMIASNEPCAACSN